ncbi:MAG: M1 family aminopeptidase [Chitinophagales bacterium]
MKKAGLFIAFFMNFLIAFSQISFRSEENPLYWKNKKPYAGYWQQDVHYKIHARIDEQTDIIDGAEQLTYFNNSPDTLYVVYFHQYQNAFTPGSYLHDLQIANDEKPHYGKYESQGLGIQITELKDGEGHSLQTFSDNTILKVRLEKPLLPKRSCIFEMKFKTYYDNGSVRRRMKKYRTSQGPHYNGCQWYPKICVYDRKSGWNTDQHLNREFYGDYGTFDVWLDFSSNYIVEATGVLKNEKEVLPDTLKQKIDLRNFASKKWDEPASVLLPYKKGERKIWTYHAINVHDFAFTADPTYRLADTFWNGIRCVAICQEPHASGWQTAAGFAARTIACYSQSFGMYEYPKMVVADAADGMEYPMITMDAGREPEYHHLLTHEIGHNWFYGMLGNNETYRAMLDEGFTQFINIWALEHLDGKYPVDEAPKNKYLRRFGEEAPHRDTRIFNSYLSDATLYRDEPLNTHSDMFNGALGQGGGYRHVYGKTATMLFQLQYVLGDSLFLRAMQHYVWQWKFCHPYPEDFRNSITQFTHADLNWFFDEWLETTKTIDYKIVSVKKQKAPGEYAIKLKRTGRMQMPIDLRVIGKNDSIHDYVIPNTWFAKTEKLYSDEAVTDTTYNHDRFYSARIPASKNPQPQLLSKWYGWDKLRADYVAVVQIPEGIKNVVIDPSGRLADVNNYNNEWKRHPEFRFDSKIYPAMSWRKYRLWLRPDVWYNSFDGFKLGLQLRGSYMYTKHVFSLQLWIPTRLAQGGFYAIPDGEKAKVSWFQYAFSYQTPLDKVLKKTSFYFQSRWLDGYEMYKVGLVKTLPNNFWVDFHLKAFTRNRTWYSNYLINRSEWSTYWTTKKPFNSSINITAGYSYSKPKAVGNLIAHWRSATLFNSFNYHYLELTHTNRVSFWRFDLRTRLYGRIGTGNDLPSESALYYAGANEEDMMDNKYYRAAGFAPQQWSGFGPTTNHLHYGGGLNLRGYAGYVIPEIDRYGATVLAYKGNSGFSLNGELDFNRIIKVRNQKLRELFGINTYLFADAGMIAYTNSRGEQQLSHFRTDAGAGIAVTIKRWGFLQDIKPLTLRFDVPFFVSNTPFVDPSPFKFRWVVGINRAF